MQFTILATDGGKHSDGKLGLAVAEDIINVGATATGQDPVDGRRLTNKIADLMEDKFRQLADAEHVGMQADGAAHLAAPLDLHADILEESVSEIAAAIADSPFATWKAFQDEARAGYPYIRTAVSKYIAIAQHMHRDWFAKGKIGHGRELTDVAIDPDCEHVKAWVAANG